MKLKDIHLRDPFIFTDRIEAVYYLIGTDFPESIADIEPHFSYYKSTDLVEWEGPTVLFQPENGFWGCRNFWAPELHLIEGVYYLVASFKGAINTRRASLILKADSPEGPYMPVSNEPITPLEWEALDATLYVDRSGVKWVIYCHEWTQNYYGRIAAQSLSDNLSSVTSEPHLLVDMQKQEYFRLFTDPRVNKKGYLTDAPFMFEWKECLYMMWSSYGDPAKGYSGGYTINLTQSLSGDVLGPWSATEIVLDENIGHPSLFETFSGERMICAHNHDTEHGKERPVLLRLDEVMQHFHGKGIAK